MWLAVREYAGMVVLGLAIIASASLAPVVPLAVTVELLASVLSCHTLSICFSDCVLLYALLENEMARAFRNTYKECALRWATISCLLARHLSMKN